MESHSFAVIAAGIILYGLVSRRLENSIVTGPMIFAAFGLLMGNALFGVVNLEFGHTFIHGLVEITLVLVLFSDAARIDLTRVRRDHNLPVRMLLVGMPLTILAGTVVALILPLGLTFWEAALLAAILAPTDAALGQSVVSSPLVPTRVRQALNIESGLNDGIALPLVLLFACLASVAHAADGGQDWAVFGAKQILFGPVAGIAIGGLGAWLIDRAASAEWMAESFQGPAILGVALLSFAGAEIIGGNGFIAAFVAGLVFGNRVRSRCRLVFEFAEAEGQLLTLLTFMIFGAAMLPEAFAQIGWATAAYVALSLTAVRMLPIAASLVGAGARGPTVAFLGWFGPRGLASILFALFVLEQSDFPGVDQIMVVTILTVAASILAHGLSAAPAAAWYAAMVRRMGECEETKPVIEMRTRTGMVARPNK